jgi:RsiW-degrading membrane proteinase PrsW (M82 family)
VRQPAFWLFAVLLGLTALYAVAEQSLFRKAAPNGWALSWVLLLLYLVPVFLTVYLLDLYEREPRSLLVGALAWGGIVATSLSGFANTFWGLFIAGVTDPDFASRWTAALTAPFVEETLKYLGVVVIYLIARDEVDSELDGFVFGAMVGLGFAVVEDVYYFIQAFGGSVGGVLAGFFVRVVGSGLYTHVLWTGISGMGLGYFVSRRGQVPFSKRFGVAAGTLAVAMFGHFLWNSPLMSSLYPDALDGLGDAIQLLLALALRGLPFLAFVVIAVRLARRREAQWVAAELEDEVARGVLTAEEVTVLTEPARRRAARRELGGVTGHQGAVLLKRLHRAQINLAMVGSRVGHGDDPDIVRQRAYVSSLRDAIAASRPPPPSG